MIYGHDKTIHSTRELDVEVDDAGQVVAVWFRCMALPFKQVRADNQRKLEMRLTYAENKVPELLAVEVSD